MNDTNSTRRARKTMNSPAALAALSRPVKTVTVHETVTYVIKVGALFVGKRGLGGLEHASHSYSIEGAERLARLLRVDGVIMARGRESLTVAG